MISQLSFFLKPDFVSNDTLIAFLIIMMITESWLSYS